MLKAKKSLRKAVVPPTLVGIPSPGNLQPLVSPSINASLLLYRLFINPKPFLFHLFQCLSSFLTVLVSPDRSSCWLLIASGSRVFELQIMGLTFSSIHSVYIYVQGVDYEV
ncbi:hypothetical protein SDJN02_06923, partial [Cucurbita argyrosperma subsp. argyrosperma]